MPQEIQGDLVVEQQQFALLAARFNDFITGKLLAGAIDTLQRHGCPDAQMTVVRVPGSYELPLAARKLAATGRYDAIVCLGCVIRGQTPHFDFIAAECAKGIAQVAMDSGTPVTFGVITADTIEQAIERAGAKAGNKGSDAALAAIELANLYARLDGAGSGKGGKKE
ncbi:MAG: 6,7-dimethyl-8-ribityllumazine synthase [Phycisphaerales bacterium]|nr:MAG: 6,7-dimethyl-8-ribityllumazine synthase [Phycisphaerales bacterium]